MLVSNINNNNYTIDSYRLRFKYMGGFCREEEEERKIDFFFTVLLCNLYSRCRASDRSNERK